MFLLPSLKLGYELAPENRPNLPQKEGIVSQPSIFRGYVRFREGSFSSTTIK